MQFIQKVKRFKKILTSPPLSPAFQKQLLSSASQVKESPNRMGQSPLLGASLSANCWSSCLMLPQLENAWILLQCLPLKGLGAETVTEKGGLQNANTVWSYLWRSVH